MSMAYASAPEACVLLLYGQEVAVQVLAEVATAVVGRGGRRRRPRLVLEASSPSMFGRTCSAWRSSPARQRASSGAVRPAQPDAVSSSTSQDAGSPARSPPPARDDHHSPLHDSAAASWPPAHEPTTRTRAARHQPGAARRRRGAAPAAPHHRRRPRGRRGPLVAYSKRLREGARRHAAAAGRLGRAATRGARAVGQRRQAAPGRCPRAAERPAARTPSDGGEEPMRLTGRPCSAHALEAQGDARGRGRSGGTARARRPCRAGPARPSAARPPRTAPSAASRGPRRRRARMPGRTPPDPAPAPARPVPRGDDAAGAAPGPSAARREPAAARRRARLAPLQPAERRLAPAGARAARGGRRRPPPPPSRKGRVRRAYTASCQQAGGQEQPPPLTASRRTGPDLRAHAAVAVLLPRADVREQRRLLQALRGTGRRRRHGARRRCMTSSSRSP